MQREEKNGKNIINHLHVRFAQLSSAELCICVKRRDRKGDKRVSE
jgi:hypothetical protein